MENKKIAVIGAGIAGLTCAYNLQEQGFEVEVFEKNPYVGGRMSSREKDGLMFDIGATHLVPLYTHMQEYVKELGIEWMRMDFAKYGVIKDKHVVPTYDALSKISKMRMMKELVKFPKDLDFLDMHNIAHLDTGDAYSYMEKKVGSEVADYIIDAFTSAYQFHGARQISMAALKAVFGSIKNKNEEWYLYRTKRGMSALPDALAAKMTVHTSTPVERVTAVDDGVEVEVNGEVRKFDAAVLATTANITSAIYENPTEAQKHVVDSTEYAATVSIALRIPEDSLPKTSIIWVPHVESEVFSGISNEIMKGEDLRSNGSSLLCTWFHHDYALKALNENWSDEQIYDAAITEMKRIFPWIHDVEYVEPFDLERWRYSMPIFKPGHLKMVDDFLVEGHQGKQNVFLCGDYMNAPWTEGALRGGERTAKQVQEAMQ